MRTFFHSVALIKTRRPSSASASTSLTRSSSFHSSSLLLDRSACERCLVKDSCDNGRRQEEAERKPDDNQGTAEKEVVDVAAVPCTVKNAGPLYESLTVVAEGNNDQGTASTGGAAQKQGAEETIQETSAKNRQHLQDLDRRIKALAPGFWGGREPQDVGLRMILQRKRDALLKEDEGKEVSSTGLSGPATATHPASTISSISRTAWPEESAFRWRERIAEHERGVQELREVEARLEALDPAFEAREDEFGGVREMLEKQREELRREVEWLEGLGWVESGRER